MTEPGTTNGSELSRGSLPNWGAVGADFDLWVPHLTPVTDALLNALRLRPGEQVLDVACGTGEPGLTIARRFGEAVRVTGVDAAEGMVAAARRKAAAEALTNIDFRAMPGERLDFPEAAFGAVVSRFGLMLFDDPAAAAREARRVLRSGGRFAVAVWHRPETWRILSWVDEAFRTYLPPSERPSPTRSTQLGGDGVLSRLLEGAGFVGVRVEPLAFDMRFASPDELWRLVSASGVYAAQFAAVPAAEHPRVRERLEALAEHWGRDGELVVPHTCLVGVASVAAARGHTV